MNPKKLMVLAVAVCAAIAFVVAFIVSFVLFRDEKKN